MAKGQSHETKGQRYEDPSSPRRGPTSLRRSSFGFASGALSPRRGELGAILGGQDLLGWFSWNRSWVCIGRLEIGEVRLTLDLLVAEEEVVVLCHVAKAPELICLY